MKNTGFYLIVFLLVAGFLATGSAQVSIGTTMVDTSTVVTHLDTPWEILWGPDDHIWMTERGGKVSRLNPETGELTTLLTIDEVHEESESGLLGMVLHPDFLNIPELFLVYNYWESSGIKERLVKYTYADGKLISPITMLEGIEGNWNHNGSRLVIDAGLKLYMTTGDEGNTSTSQDLNSLNGKILRMNLDGSVPEDNPIPGSYIWTWGHRNPQGLVISPTGIMYSSEHGPSSDDELNIIEKGRNYGWPDVMGFCDGVSEKEFCTANNVFEPIAAWTPTLAVAGTDFFHHTAIPEWHNCVLVTSLKAGRLVALKLTGDGKSVLEEEAYFMNWFGRLRDICVSPDGRVFMAVSNGDGRGTIRPGDDRIVEIAPYTNTAASEIIPEASLVFSVYPNPLLGNELSINYSTKSEAVLIIYSQVGAEVSRIMLSPVQKSTTISIPGAAGVYFIKVHGNDDIQSIKVLKI